MKEVTPRDIIGRAFLFAGLTAAMYYIHLLSYRYEKRHGKIENW